MHIILCKFGSLKPDVQENLLKDMKKIHTKHTFSFDTEIKTQPEFRIGFFKKKPIFSATLILDYLQKYKDESKGIGNTSIYYVITDQLLVKEKSITSSLYGGLCRRSKGVLIMSSARLANYSVMLTVVNHELGHLVGMPHCTHPTDNIKGIMKEGVHDVDVVASNFWCDICIKKL